MLEFIGLEWDPLRCLAFERTERIVITANEVRVRQKLNRQSIERWRHYQARWGRCWPCWSRLNLPEGCRRGSVARVGQALNTLADFQGHGGIVLAGKQFHALGSRRMQ